MLLSAAVCEPHDGARNGLEMRLLCRAGSSLCALPLEHVVEIMRILPIESIAHAPSFVLGLSIIRGTPTPIVDTALLCSGRTAPFHRLVIVSAGTRIVALAVDNVLDVRAIGTDESLPPLLGEAASDVISTIGRLDAALLLFLSAARIVPDELFERLGRHESAA